MVSSLKTFSFITAGLALLFILYIRVTKGLDLTDEMQHYGEIKGLLESGKLFSNDLFIQQLVYVLFYPLFYLYHITFGYEGFVLFGRLILALLNIFIFVYAYRKFLSFDFFPMVAAFSALAIIFALPGYGLFSLNYNTVSQCVWIIFLLKFFAWKQEKPVVWAGLVTLVAFSHPTSAIVMAFIVVVRFTTEGRYKEVVNLAYTFIAIAVVVVPMMLYFASMDEYLSSLAFSSGYGVGVLFSRFEEVSLLVAILAMFFVPHVFKGWYQKVGSVLLIIGGMFFFADKLYHSLIVISALSALSYCWLSSIHMEKPFRYRVYWLVFALLLYATMLGGTSGNGIRQMARVFMIALPFLLGIAVSQAVTINKLPKIYGFLVLAVVIFYSVQMFEGSPYREAAWSRLNTAIDTVPEFRFIKTTPERVKLIQDFQQHLKADMEGQAAVIVTRLAGLYFILNAKPETCMFFMHSLTSDKSERALLSCLQERSPERYLDISSNYGRDPRIKQVMGKFAQQRHMKCWKKGTVVDPASKVGMTQHQHYTLCGTTH